jgi:UDP-3-O-[3-hydroxymyristoyl] glucosamine N-acyltransferase
MKLKEIAELVGGTLKGDGGIEIGDVRSIEDEGSGFITFLIKKKLLPSLKQSKALAVIVEHEIDTDKAQIIVPNPALAFARVVNAFHPAQRPRPRVDPSASIGENVQLGKDVTLLANVVVGDDSIIGDEVVLHPGVVVGANCRIGDRTVLYPNVTLYDRIELGKDVILHAGVVVGADGFGYTPDEQGCHYKINQLGRVVIEDHVEVGANSCIDRAAMGTTLIKEGTKIDNLVQVAHNCTIGEHSILVAQVGIAGSCKLGHHVVMAGQAGLSDHVTIGNQVTLAGQSGTFRDVVDKGVYGGYPSVPLGTWKKYVTTLPKLPEMARKLKELEGRLNAIEKE